MFFLFPEDRAAIRAHGIEDGLDEVGAANALWDRLDAIVRKEAVEPVLEVEL